MTWCVMYTTVHLMHDAGSMMNCGNSITEYFFIQEALAIQTYIYIHLPKTTPVVFALQG